MITDHEGTVLELIKGNQGEIVGCLQELIHFKTITPSNSDSENKDACRGLQDYVFNILDELDFELDVWEVEASKLERFPGSGVKPNRDLRGMPVLAGKRNGSGGGKSLILNGHY
jgi:acetylornithine deacetylase